MNPFFFGASAQPLYGVYHPPREQTHPVRAVLLCYPAGIEYMRAHRAFRQLTSLLVRSGVHVLRFDYFGTGDSAGSVEDASLARWQEDVELAIEELKANAGVEKIDLVGLRLGGTLAVLAASRRADVSRLLLWDPVISGEAYLEELLTYAELPARNGNPTAWPAGTVGVGGFALTAGMRSEIAAIDLRVVPPPRVPITLIASEERALDLALCDAWRGGEVDVECRCVPSENRWIEGDAFGSALIPQDIIQAVVETVTTEFRT